MNYITQPNITAKYLEIKSTQTSENVFSPVVLSCYYWKAFGDICLLGLSVLYQTDSSLEKKFQSSLICTPLCSICVTLHIVVWAQWKLMICHYCFN